MVATQSSNDGVHTVLSARTPPVGEPTEFGKDALQALPVSIRGSRKTVFRTLFKLRLNEQVKLRRAQQTPADRTVEKVAEQGQAFERTARGTLVNLADFRFEHACPDFPFGPFEDRALDAARNRETEVGLACTELLGI